MFRQAVVVGDPQASDSGAPPGIHDPFDVDADHPAPAARWSARFPARFAASPLGGPVAALTEATAFGARGGSALRRILTIAIAAAFGVSAWDALAHLPFAAEAWLVHGSLALVIGMLAALVVGAASASAAGRARFRRHLRRLGYTAPPWSGEARALANGAVWFVLGVLAVAFAAPAFVPLPGGPVAWAAGIGLVLGSLTNRLHRSTQRHDATRTFNLVAMLVFAGSVASMGATSTGQWWRLNFSTLGTSDDLAAACFNVAVVLSGSAMAVMAGELTAGVASRARPRAGGVGAMRMLIAALGGSLIGVGLVPIDTDTELHNAFALGAAGCFAVLALGVQLWARRMPRRFVLVSYAFVAVTVGTMYAYDVAGLFTLTVFEIVAFTLVFAWLILLVAATAEAGPELRAARAAVARASAVPATHPLAEPPLAVVHALAAARVPAAVVHVGMLRPAAARHGGRGPGGGRGAGSPGRRGPSRAQGARRGRARARGGSSDGGSETSPPGLG